MAVSVGLSVLVLAGCTEKSDVKLKETTAIDSMQTQLLNLQNQLSSTNNELTRTQVKFFELEESMNKPKVTGNQIVNASELYIRSGAGTEHQPLGNCPL